jgi:hypothetical protein
MDLPLLREIIRISANCSRPDSHITEPHLLATCYSELIGIEPSAIVKILRLALPSQSKKCNNL